MQLYKIHIFDQKNNEILFFLPTYLPYFFSDRYRKQTISFFRPYFIIIIIIIINITIIIIIIIIIINIIIFIIIISIMISIIIIMIIVYGY